MRRASWVRGLGLYAAEMRPDARGQASLGSAEPYRDGLQSNPADVRGCLQLPLLPSEQPVGGGGWGAAAMSLQAGKLGWRGRDLPGPSMAAGCQQKQSWHERRPQAADTMVLVRPSRETLEVLEETPPLQAGFLPAPAPGTAALPE